MASNGGTLERAAAFWGIDREYTDTWGRRHIAPDTTLRAVLTACGAPEELDGAIDELERIRWSKPFDSTVVIPEGTEAIPVRIPSERAGASIKLEINWENGDKQHHWYWGPELAELERVVIGGDEFIAKRFPLPALRLGYHSIRIYWMKEPDQEVFGEARFIVHPKQAKMLDGKVAGVALSLYGLRSSSNWGCGDFTDLLGAIDAFAPAKAAFIALNPLHAIPNRQPFNRSPYLPECSLYRNYLYLDVEKVPGFTPDAEARTEIEALRAAELVEYERVANVKLRFLRKAFASFRESGYTDSFGQYVQREGTLLNDFAIYCALWEHMHAANPEVWLWTDWPEPYRNPRSHEVSAFALEHSEEVSFWKFLQWQVDQQLAHAQAHALAKGMKIGLYHDLALATDQFGADLWAHRPFYAKGARVGAPPDELAPSGQDWGFPPPDRDAHRDNGYQLFAQSIRNNVRHGGALRIDHVMRFFRLFWIADGLTAAQGAYVRDYADNLLGILALESVRNNFIVIGEDLGTVEWSVREKLGSMGILGYRLLWFEKNGDGSFRLPGEYPERAAVSTTTHDLPTLAGFSAGRDIEARRAAGLVDQAAYDAQWASRHDEIRRLDEALAAAGFAGDAIGFVLATPSTVAIINQEDLTGETEQQNLPASTWQHPNWQRKMKFAVEDLGPIVRNLKEKIERSRR